jgi:hypothetical protein
MILLTLIAMQDVVLAKNKLACLHLLLFPVQKTSLCEKGARSTARTEGQQREGADKAAFHASTGNTAHWKHTQSFFKTQHEHLAAFVSLKGSEWQSH